MTKSKFNTDRVCFLYAIPALDGQMVSKSICMSMDYIPVVGERLIFQRIEREDYGDLNLRVTERELVLDDNYCHWNLYCDVLQ